MPSPMRHDVSFLRLGAEKSRCITKDYNRVQYHHGKFYAGDEVKHSTPTSIGHEGVTSHPGLKKPSWPYWSRKAPSN